MLLLPRWTDTLMVVTNSHTRNILFLNGEGALQSIFLHPIFFAAAFFLSKNDFNK